jgi:hypothetical protein
MISFKRNFDYSPYKRMTTNELQGLLQVLRGSDGREEAIVKLQESYWQNMQLTWVDGHNFDDYYIDEVDVVIDELVARATAQPAREGGKR